MFRGLLKHLGLEKRSGSLGDLERLLLSVTQTAAGIAVGPETALQYPPVLSAVRLISESIGQLPVHLYRKAGEDRSRADGHPVERLLSKSPAPLDHTHRIQDFAHRFPAFAW